MIDVLKSLLDVSKPLSQSGDLLDRLNAVYTVWLLIVFAVIVGAKQYIFNPIQCWVPKEFSNFWEEYAENYCWIQNTYRVPFDKQPIRLPPDADKPSLELGFYQWTAFILLLSAFFFHFPAWFWTITNSLSGMNLEAIYELADGSVKASDSDKRSKALRALADHLQNNIQLIKIGGHSSMSLFEKYFIPYRLSVIYIVVKSLYLVNSLGQFFMLNAMLGTKDLMYGWKIFSNLLHGKDWEESGFFPRVTMCDFTILDVGQTRRYTVQCVLPVNMLNEKIFILLWFWVLLMSLLNAFNLARWVAVCFCPRWRIRFFQSFPFPGLGQTKRPRRSQSLRVWLDKDLSPDALFVLRLLNGCCGSLLVVHLLQVLWKDSHKCGDFSRLSTSSSTPDVGRRITRDQSGLFESRLDVRMAADNGFKECIVQQSAV